MSDLFSKMPQHTTFIFAEALQKSHGRLLPFGWYHLVKALFMKRRAKMLDLLLVAVKPEYQNKGVNALLFSDLIPVYQKLVFVVSSTGVCHVRHRLSSRQTLTSITTTTGA